MAQLVTRIRSVVSSRGNEGAVANVRAELGRAATARHALDQSELRLATAPAEAHRAA